MSYSVGDNGITVKTRINVSWWQKLLTEALVIILILGLILWVVDDINKGKSDIGGYAFLSVCIVMGQIWPWVWKDSISADKNGINFDLPKTKGNVKFSSVSKAEISEDNCLVIFNKSGKVDTTADLEKFEHDELQLLINFLCKRIALSIDGNVATQKSLKLPEYAVAEQVVTGPTRTTAAEETGNVTPTERQTTPSGRQRRIMTSDKPTGEKGGHKENPYSNRRLEL